MDEAYWDRWITEHGFPDDLVGEVTSLAKEISVSRRAGWSDDRIVKAGRRQAELVHLLLEFYTHPDDIRELAEDIGLPVQTLIGLNLMHLAVREHGHMANPSWN